MHSVAQAAERLLGEIPPPMLISTPRGPLACAVAGEGPPLLALHGIMGGLDQSWLLARALLGGPFRRRVLAVARPGYPGTPLETGGTAEAQAEAYAALLDTLGLDAVHIAAFSGGGPSALAFARLFPGRCRGLLLVSACTGRLEARPEGRAVLARARFLTRLPGLRAVPAWAVRHWTDTAARGFVPAAAERTRVLADPEAGPLLAALLLSSCLHMGERMPGTFRDVAQFAALPACCDAGVGAPLLALHGTADGIVPFAQGEEIARRVGGARLLTLKGGTHMALFTHLAEVRRAAAAFLEAPG
ncbi:alpha/beta fold hydrolase [Xanthobacter sediminis]|uniref:alpha/beta fold hydrolase n=1 Tax=Xanthobacter sediminis TaxID=3119926 RepID=UPI0037273014